MSAETKAIGARLREAREALPYWTRGELARMMRTAATPQELPHVAHVRSLTDMIKQWETGKWVPRRRYRVLYARVTGMTEGDLFGPPQTPAIAHRDILEIGVAAGAVTMPPGIGHHGPVAPELVGYFRQQLPGHYRADMWLGPHMLIPTVDAQTRLLQQLVQAAETPVRRGLLEMGVAFAALLGWLYQDAARVLGEARRRAGRCPRT